MGIGMGLFGFEGTADVAQIDREGKHFDESFRRDENIFDVEKLYVFIVEELVDMFPNAEKSGEYIEEICFFKSFIPFEFTMNRHFKGMVVVSRVYF